MHVSAANTGLQTGSRSASREPYSFSFRRYTSYDKPGCVAKAFFQAVENYFNYFTEIEEHFQRRRGTILILSPLDWSLMEMWKEAGIPLEAVLRGIDSTFDKWERRRSQTRKVNGLAFCSQEVMAAAEELKEAAVGGADAGVQQKEAPGIPHADIVAFLRHNGEQLASACLLGPAQELAAEAAGTLHSLANALSCTSQGSGVAGNPDYAAAGSVANPMNLEDLERRLTVIEERLMAALLAATPEEALLNVRAEADRDLAPYRRKMTAAQIDQLHKQYVHKRLLEQYGVPRLSLFYM